MIHLITVRIVDKESSGNEKNMISRLIVLVIVLFIVFMCCTFYLGYYIGCIKGFKKCRDIDDQILDKYAERITNENN